MPYDLSQNYISLKKENKGFGRVAYVYYSQQHLLSIRKKKMIITPYRCTSLAQLLFWAIIDWQ